MTQTNEQTDAEYLDGLVGGMAGLGIDAARLRTIADKLRNSASEGTPHTPTPPAFKIGERAQWVKRDGRLGTIRGLETRLYVTVAWDGEGKDSVMEAWAIAPVSRTATPKPTEALGGDEGGEGADFTKVRTPRGRIVELYATDRGVPCYAVFGEAACYVDEDDGTVTDSYDASIAKLFGDGSWSRPNKRIHPAAPANLDAYFDDYAPPAEAAPAVPAVANAPAETEQGVPPEITAAIEAIDKMVNRYVTARTSASKGGN